MKCRKCGADLLDTDTFCVKCGQKADQPMICSNCGEQLRDGERFCHKCGSPVEAAMEDDEIPISRQNTVDIPFDQIEQGLLIEARQAIVKRPDAERTEQRKPEEANEERYAESNRPQRIPRQMPPRPRREEAYDEEDDEEDSGTSGMKVVTVILGIAVVAVALVIGYIFWQRNRTPNYERPEAGAEQGEQADEAEGGNSADTQGRIQILSNVNVRNKPTTDDSEVMMVARTGETYEYYELVDDAWYHIKLEDGKDGYVSAKYVEDLK